MITRPTDHKRWLNSYQPGSIAQTLLGIIQEICIESSLEHLVHHKCGGTWHSADGVVLFSLPIAGCPQTDKDVKRIPLS
ncbi:hypothetical protein LBUCD034_0163 [Lentilactobacillus buchneri subsp. silagei CD034]|uniref:Uncharacterized protein n=1 Tax=Lentilactobacillus buchneri subsp. silagei CD034 TaxID=1071400 RepID=J9VXU9_LENBU|nr:hypothetical protein LBUCD034_0163 [Lentilactobacillus buchneri subsp. silagei CD034]